MRSEDEHIARRLHGLIAESYRMLGYEIIRVPVMPIPRRADFVLDHI